MKLIILGLTILLVMFGESSSVFFMVGLRQVIYKILMISFWSIASGFLCKWIVLVVLHYST